MKKIILCVLHMLISSAFQLGAQNHQTFTINGQLPNSKYDQKYAYLMLLKDDDAFPNAEKNANDAIIDSAIIDQGQFTVKGYSYNKGELYLVKIQNSNISGWIVGETGIIKIIFTGEEPNLYSYVSGTPINDKLTEEFLIPSYTYYTQIDSIKKAEAPEQESLSKEALSSISREYYDKYFNFIKAHAEYPVGEYLFTNLALFLPEKDRTSFLTNLPKDTRDRYEKKIAGIQNKIKSTSLKIGEDMIDFECITLKDQQIRLSDIAKSKKLLLLDFWASWCQPCLKEIPEMINLYDSYKDSGLEIIGISLDEQNDVCKKTVEKHEMTWPQVLDKEGELSKAYKVITIPQTILIDQRGKILATGFRGKQLTEMIKIIIQNLPK